MFAIDVFDICNGVAHPEPSSTIEMISDETKHSVKNGRRVASMSYPVPPRVPAEGIVHLRAGADVSLEFAYAARPDSEWVQLGQPSQQFVVQLKLRKLGAEYGVEKFVVRGRPYRRSDREKVLSI